MRIGQEMLLSPLQSDTNNPIPIYWSPEHIPPVIYMSGLLTHITLFVIWDIYEKKQQGKNRYLLGISEYPLILLSILITVYYVQNRDCIFYPQKRDYSIGFCKKVGQSDFRIGDIEFFPDCVTMFEDSLN